jgi:dTMP kinase
MGLEFQLRLRHGFLDLVREAPERCRLIDGDRDPDTVSADIAALVDALP